MRDSMSHRGPDDAGVFTAAGIALASRRLSIQDLSHRGHMPMSSADGRYWIAYNGEVYNFKELRDWLQSKGVHFRSNTDTEVVLYLFAYLGPSMLPRLNGMFAIAIWDSHERRLFLARDRPGVKPLYYRAMRDGLAFASEAKALLALASGFEFDHAVWQELLHFRFVAGDRTPFRGVEKLKPGHYMLWCGGNNRVVRWWNLAERAREAKPLRSGETAEWFSETFDDSIRLRRISDVPVGVLLSGGLDSSSAAASLAMQAGSGAASFTIRFAEPGYDEGPLAASVAKRWNLDHHELRVAPNDLPDLLEEASWLNDEPTAHASDLYLLSIARYAKPRVTVLLSGEGADETLGGYVRYRPLLHPALLELGRHTLHPRIAGLMNRRVQKLSRFLQLDSTDNFVLFNAGDVLPRDLECLGLAPATGFPYRQEILSEAKALYPKEPVRQAMYLDQHTFLCSLLDRNDRMTMGASIECRVPFLDFRLVESIAALPTKVLFANGRGKSLLRQSLGHRLPQELLRHKKWGFSVPWRNYLRTNPRLRSLVAELSHLEPVRSAPMNHAMVAALARQFLAGSDQHEPIIRQLVKIVVWHDAFCRGARLKDAAVAGGMR